MASGTSLQGRAFQEPSLSALFCSRTEGVCFSEGLGTFITGIWAGANFCGNGKLGRWSSSQEKRPLDYRPLCMIDEASKLFERIIAASPVAGLDNARAQSGAVQLPYRAMHN